MVNWIGIPFLFEVKHLFAVESNNLELTLLTFSHYINVCLEKVDKRFPCIQ
jgi:hypothetical protein